MGRGWIPELHPRDGKGRFVKRGGSPSSWQRTVANRAAPGRRKAKPQRGELPRGAGSMTEYLESLGEGESPSDEELRQVGDYLRRTTSMRDDASGLEVDVIDVVMVEGELSASYRIVDRNGKRAGRALRSWRLDPRDGRPQISHDVLVLDEDVRGGGFAARWNRHNEDVYRANGIKSIELYANVDVGGYAWAKQGYDFADEMAMADFADNISAMMEDMPDGPIFDRLRGLVDRSMDPSAWEAGTAPTPLEWAMVGWTPGAETWPGKEMLLGSAWNGSKQL